MRDWNRPVFKGCPYVVSKEYVDDAAYFLRSKDEELAPMMPARLDCAYLGGVCLTGDVFYAYLDGDVYAILRSHPRMTELPHLPEGLKWEEPAALWSRLSGSGENDTWFPTLLFFLLSALFWGLFKIGASNFEKEQ